MEKMAKENGRPLTDMSLAEMDELWKKVKQKNKSF
jgi:uncharacterized protein YabN with tetrapyrrole methylase and pyrophosphatase domain